MYSSLLELINTFFTSLLEHPGLELSVYFTNFHLILDIH